MIYICIPALNEAQTVGVLLWRIRQVMAEFGRDYHLLVVDDGSTDDTAEVLAPYARVLPLTVVRHERNRGYAAAVETLAREAVARSTHPKRDSAVFLQADFTEPPEEIPALVRRIEGGADVVGSAVSTVEGEVTRGMRWSRAGLPWLLKRSAVPREITDPFSGFRAYRLQVLKRALADVEGKPLLSRAGWAANAELLVRVAPHVRRAEQAEVGLRYTRRDRESRFRPWDAVREAWALARLAPGRSRAVRPAEERDTLAEREVPAATPDRMSAADLRAARDARDARPRTRAASPPPSTEAAAPEARPPREPRPRREKPPRPEPAVDAVAVDEDAIAAPVAEIEEMDAAPAVDGAEDAPRKAKRKPRRRKSARARAAAAEGSPGEMDASGADPSSADESGVDRSEEGGPRAEGGEGVAMDSAAALNDGSAPEEGAAPARRRPRRPRRRKPAASREGGDAAEGAPAPVPESEG
ncbi:glycosyltransferase family 2 protein [Longimicrobium terrae]|uniref:Glycosyltransferase 2-like domain-containing protein n=1 Tax=Longimicrobium terrae TaxID=1639882 RepID=A0A841H0P1_9BACT|nr:glycosyltransferase family 2 protein [Longimicrobium terrae]MBB4637099.1 hypothetical protein [Longimicrobium terrae]MBB6071641.1 hypothetical protein [Longimicrobium terrae]NNC29943.1 glycosyltransferase family 2 protein [Longimicrobium terrae]